VEETWEFAALDMFIRFKKINSLIPFLLLVSSCTTVDGKPEIVSFSSVDKQHSSIWEEINSQSDLSRDNEATERFNLIAQSVIEASSLSSDNWDIRLFDKSGSAVFVLPENRLGGYGIDNVSDDRLASTLAFDVASLELEKTREIHTGQSQGSKDSVKTSQTQRLTEALGLDPDLLPPTADMRREATIRAEEIIERAGFKPDFYISSNRVSAGPLK